jgi:hypothetical protein
MLLNVGVYCTAVHVRWEISGPVRGMSSGVSSGIRLSSLDTLASKGTMPLASELLRSRTRSGSGSINLQVRIPAHTESLDVTRAAGAKFIKLVSQTAGKIVVTLTPTVLGWDPNACTTARTVRHNAVRMPLVHSSSVSISVEVDKGVRMQTARGEGEANRWRTGSYWVKWGARAPERGKWNPLRSGTTRFFFLPSREKIGVRPPNHSVQAFLDQWR